MLFTSHAVISAMELGGKPAWLSPDVNPFRPTFMGMEVVKSGVFPIPCPCKECHGAGYAAGASFCAPCKGTGGYDVIGMVQDAGRGFLPPTGSITKIVEPWKRRFPPRFPPSVAVPLRDVSIPVGGRS